MEQNCARPKHRWDQNLGDTRNEWDRNKEAGLIGQVRQVDPASERQKPPTLRPPDSPSTGRKKHLSALRFFSFFFSILLLPLSDSNYTRCNSRKGYKLVLWWRCMINCWDIHKIQIKSQSKVTEISATSLIQSDKQRKASCINNNKAATVLSVQRVTDMRVLRTATIGSRRTH